MVGNNSAPKFHMVLRSQTRKRPATIADLPVEVLFNILILLPAEFLQLVARLVCPLWNRIICDPEFASTHLKRSSSTVIAQHLHQSSIVRYLDVRESSLHLKDFKYNFSNSILSSCNGLVLLSRSLVSREFAVVNPLTNKQWIVPPLPLLIRSLDYNAGLAYAACSRVYKVVAFRVVVCHAAVYCKCLISTVGVSKAWREIDSDDIRRKERFLMRQLPAVSTGFLYWASSMSNIMIICNVETETIKQIRLPEGSSYTDVRKFFLAMGETVSYLKFNNKFTLEVWALKDYETEEWLRLPDINLQALGSRLNSQWNRRNVLPVSWLKNGEAIIIHEAKHRKYRVFDLKNPDRRPYSLWWYPSKVIPHINSLVWI